MPANERAALLWHRGQCAEALAAWHALPESPGRPLQPRHGPALHWAGSPRRRPALAKAIAAIPEASGWNALARLYLAVAEIHG